MLGPTTLNQNQNDESQAASMCDALVSRQLVRAISEASGPYGLQMFCDPQAQGLSRQQPWCATQRLREGGKSVWGWGMLGIFLAQCPEYRLE